MLGVLRPSSAATQQKQDAERREREGVDLRNGGGGGGGGGNGGGGGGNVPRIIWFRPTDKRVPLIAIRASCCSPLSCLSSTDPFPSPSQRPSKPPKTSSTDPTSTRIDCSSRVSRGGRFRVFIRALLSLASSLSASSSRFRPSNSFGVLVEELGQIGDIETETNALLKDCNFSAEGEQASDPSQHCMKADFSRSQTSPRPSSSVFLPSPSPFPSVRTRNLIPRRAFR